MLVVAVFNSAAQLTERDDGDLEFLGKRFQRRRNLGEFLHAVLVGLL